EEEEEEEEEKEVVEEIETTEDVAEEARGLRGRLSSLIGRDLGERHDDPAARIDPPMTGAPVPRIDPTDRALHRITTVAPSPSPEAMPTTSRQTAEKHVGGLGQDD